MNEGLNDEYTSNNERVLEEIGDFKFTSHKNAIIKMRNYFNNHLDKINKEAIMEDPYLKKINTIWKGKQ
jgi:GDP-L-fucose synthase